MTNEINKAIVGVFTDINVYDNEAPQEANYPYAVVTSKRLTIDDNISKWIVEVNVWDKNKYYSRAEATMDSIEKELDFKRLLSGSNFLCLFKAQRDNVEDSDKSIKRVRTQFDMTVYESEA